MKNKQEIEFKVKEILIDVLNLNKSVDEINNTEPLFGTDEAPGLFDDSLAVLEVTSVLMAEFDEDASIFSEKSFQTIGSLVTCIYNAKKEQLT